MGRKPVDLDRKMVRNFIISLAKTGMKAKEIKEMVEKAYPGKGLKKTQIYDIIKGVKEGKDMTDQRKFNAKKTKRTPLLIAKVEEEIERNRRLTVKELSRLFDRTETTIFRVLTKDLGLVKKSAPWVPKLLTDEQKAERVRCSQGIINLSKKAGMGNLKKVITMDESAVSFHTPETKRQSKQWIKKGEPGPVKAKVHATRTKQMVVCFMDQDGLIYTNYVPRGRSVTGAYTIECLKKFLKAFRKKRPVLARSGKWILHWDNAPVHSANIVKDYLKEKGIKTYIIIFIYF